MCNGLVGFVTVPHGFVCQVKKKMGKQSVTACHDLSRFCNGLSRCCVLCVLSKYLYNTLFFLTFLVFATFWASRLSWLRDGFVTALALLLF